MKYQVMPPLSKEEYAALKADIADNGIRVPVDVDETGTVLDGHHRQQLAAELGIECPTRVVADLSEEDKRHHALAVNTARRTLNREQRRALIRAELQHDPHRSDRAIGRWIGVDGKTVASVREEMEEEQHEQTEEAERQRQEAVEEAAAYIRSRVKAADRGELFAWARWIEAHDSNVTFGVVQQLRSIADAAVTVHERFGCEYGCRHTPTEPKTAEIPHSILEGALTEPDYSPYEAHEFLAVFPLVPVDEFAMIAASIRDSGLFTPITVNYDRTILVDGRIRLLACRALGAEPEVRVLGSHYDERKTLDYIWSANMMRTSLTPDQQAAFVAEAEAMKREAES